MASKLTDLLFNLVPDNVRNAAILAVARHLISVASGSLLVYLLSHSATNSQATDIVEGFSSLSLALVSFGCSLFDVKGVDKKIQIALEMPPPSLNLESESQNKSLVPTKPIEQKQPELPFTSVLTHKNHPFGDI